MRPLVLGACLRKVAQVIGRKPPARELYTNYQKVFNVLCDRESQMSKVYETSTFIERVKTYHREMLYSAVPVPHHSLGVIWICGRCKTGELGLTPHVGDGCPQCGARVEEVMRSKRHRAATA